MKKSTIYQELKNQFIYFFVAYEILKTNNLKLFAVLFLLVLADLIYNSKNIIQGLTQINTSSELDTTSDLKKSKLNRILIAILFFGICFLTYVLLVRKDFWILLF
jgi:low temperature requirement protein LtrA